MAVIHANIDNFEQEVLSSSQPVLVDFWASWCGPCKMIAPILDEISEELSGKAKVVKVNVDEENELAAQYGVMSIPMLFVFKDGELIDQAVGVQSKQALLDMLPK